ncbi:predicted protein [Histoplasma mississippiense (nom. inval.)]|uniref:predicted protein n=1 Tax=Ajellomyces capsulatus (strain NAm1 / WU24) TaxID=2059318 RepID=UPI000157BCF7|nr:predicted protein [Histoplasma mississippiense (nom. inval.)]EDN06131.1 predicted protein [Histoplasma mississippiense (nom. inval.)]
MTAPVPDFHSIVHSPSFTFLVGPDHTKLTIQSGLAKHVSQRLDELMNNGHTRESRHRIAVLEEEDVETFVGFCEYAYTGDYTVPNPRATPIGHRDSQGMAPPLASAMRPPAPSPPVTPQPGEEPQEIVEGEGGEGGRKDGDEQAQQEATGGMGAEDTENMNLEERAAATPGIPPSEAVSAAPDWFDFEPTPKPEMPKLGPAFQGSFISSKSRGLGLWGEFASLQYIHHQRASGGMTLPSPLSRNTPGYGIAVSGTEPAPYLLFHAKLSSAVIQLLHFTFTRTKRDDPVFSLTSSEPSAQRQNELRKLVTHYAACKVRELASYQPPAPSAASVESMDTQHLGFRDLLDALGELASDLVYRMM